MPYRKEIVIEVSVLGESGSQSRGRSNGFASESSVSFSLTTDKQVSWCGRGRVAFPHKFSRMPRNKTVPAVPPVPGDAHQRTFSASDVNSRAHTSVALFLSIGRRDTPQVAAPTLPTASSLIATFLSLGPARVASPPSPRARRSIVIPL